MEVNNIDKNNIDKKIIGAVVIVVIAVVAGVTMTMRDSEDEDEGISVALNVGAYNNPWRIQHMEVFRNVAGQMENEGEIDTYEVVASGEEISNQASDIRSLAEKGYDLIIVNPNDPSALNSAIEDAHDLGAKVVSTDQHIESEYVTNVIIDQSDWFEDISRWVFEQIDGEGDVVVVHGLPGHPSNDARKEGMERALEDYPDINIITEIDGNWQYDRVQDRFSSTFSSHRGDIDAVLLQDGMIDGVLWALDEAGVEPDDPDYPKVLCGDHTMRFIRDYWVDLKDQGVQVYMRANPPGYYSTSSLKVGVELTKGRELDTTHSWYDEDAFPGDTVWIPLGPEITNQNVEDFIDQYEDEDNTYRVDYEMSEEEVEDLFE